jgi:hypothetical protein
MQSYSVWLKLMVLYMVNNIHKKLVSFQAFA